MSETCPELLCQQHCVMNNENYICKPSSLETLIRNPMRSSATAMIDPHELDDIESQ